MDVPEESITGLSNFAGFSHSVVNDYAKLMK